MSEASTTKPVGGLRALPARFSLPLVGDSLAFLADPVKFLTTRKKELGPVFRANLLGEDVVCFTGPEAFELFLDERFFTRDKGSPPHIRRLFGDDAIPFLEGDAFKERKALLMEAFTNEALEGYVPTLERVLGRYLRRWAELHAFHWVPELVSLGLAAAASIFLGVAADREDPELERLLTDAVNGILSVPVDLPFTRFGRALRAGKKIRKRIADEIDARDGAGREPDALGCLLRAKEKSGYEISREALINELFHFFGAYVLVIGGLSFVALNLARHPSVRDRVRDEARTKLRGRPITWAALGELEYLDRVCRESRRVQPITPVTFFARVKERCSFEGIEIPEGLKAVGCIAPTLLDEKTFPEATKFDPDRWLGARATPRHHAAWVPHGGGGHLTHHRCAGEVLADLMLKLFAVRLVRDYEWTLPAQDLTPTVGQLYATPKDGLDVRFLRAPTAPRP
jgi:retinoid hydroxylase